MGSLRAPFFLTMLTAINSILQSCGQAPVTTLDQTNPDVAIATQTLNEVSREVQAEGWSFNKELGVDMSVDNNNEIPIASNILWIDATDNGANVNYNLIRRNGKLYDKVTHTDKFPDTDMIVCDVIFQFEWEDLPIPMQDFITARAATIVSSRIVGDPNQYQMLQQREAFSRTLVMEYECNQGDYTFFGHSGETNKYRSFQPYQALYR